LRFLEGFRIKETALIIGKKVNNVKVIQNRAIAPICAFFWLDQSPLFRTLHIRHDFEIAEISSSDNVDIEFTFVNSRSNENMESTTYRGTVIAQRGQYICIVPTTSASIPIGSLGYGSNVTTELKQDGWWHLTRINGAHRHLPVDTGFDLANAEYIICQTCDDQKACGNYS
jgi:hypothetical protein